MIINEVNVPSPEIGMQDHRIIGDNAGERRSQSRISAWTHRVLYSTIPKTQNAVEYYNEKGDDRRNKYYQRKMQDFLQQPSITEVLQKGKKS